MAEFEFWDCFIGIPEDAFCYCSGGCYSFGIAPQIVQCGKLGGCQETTPQVQAQKEQLSAKDRQFGELHVLVQQARAALPAPRDKRPWWRRVWWRD